MKFFGITALLLAAAGTAKADVEFVIGGIFPEGQTPTKGDAVGDKVTAALDEVKDEVNLLLADGGGRLLADGGGRRLPTDVYIDFEPFAPTPEYGTGEYQFQPVPASACPFLVLAAAGFNSPAELEAAIPKQVCYIESFAYKVSIFGGDFNAAWNFDCSDRDSVVAAFQNHPSPFIQAFAPRVPNPLEFDPSKPDVCFNDIVNSQVMFSIQANIAQVRDANDVKFSFGEPTKKFYTLMNGDPHIKTLGGSWFEYHGECDLVFMRAADFIDGKDIAIHARTSIRQSYSFITSAAVRLGESTLEVASYGAYALNGVDSADLSKETFEGYKINYSKPNKKNTIFEIVLSDTQKIVLSAFKDLVAVKMEGFGDSFANASGLLGTRDGKLLGRDGVTEFTDMNAFGQEWQVRDTEPMLFRSARAPQYPTETCRLPKVSMEDTRRRLGEGMARENAERACAHFSGVQFENCVFDVMAIGDIDIAQAGAY